MRTVIIAALLAFAIVLAGTARVDAGCGCNKPPPPPASIRPGFASPGDRVTLFSSSFQPGRSYTVTFKGATASMQVTGIVTNKRDLADRTVKPQLVVMVPPLPPGPTRVRVRRANGSDDVLLDIPNNAFTLLQAPIALAEGNGETVASCYRAAVGADNTVYIPLDISNIAQHMIFSGVAAGYPLMYGGQDVSIYNSQGFLMQLLGPDQANIFGIADPGGTSSFQLTYDRHEFVTYNFDHDHTAGLGLDNTDQSWHTDGTYHVDHGHLIIAIHGTVENQGPPPPGVTPTFDLHITTALADGTNGVATSNRIVWSNECGLPVPF